MLGHGSVFSKSVLVRWSGTMFEVKSIPVDHDLGKNALLEEKGGSNEEVVS